MFLKDTKKLLFWFLVNNMALVILIDALLRHSLNRPRLEVWSKNIVRLVVNSGEKNFFTSKRPHVLALKAVKGVRF